jgi:hypothetical protein
MFCLELNGREAQAQAQARVLPSTRPRMLIMGRKVSSKSPILPEAYCRLLSIDFSHTFPTIIETMLYDACAYVAYPVPSRLDCHAARADRQDALTCLPSAMCPGGAVMSKASSILLYCPPIPRWGYISISNPDLLARRAQSASQLSSKPKSPIISMA